MDSIRKQSFRSFEIIVVDNGSTDDSAEYLSAQDDVRVLWLERNQGFGAPNNRAVDCARGELIATVNNDMVLDAAWLDHLVCSLRGDSRCFSAQGCNLLLGDPGRIDGCGLGIRPCGASRRLLNKRPADSVGIAPREIFAASAGAALYRRSVFRELGEFDESYFVYYEDFDLGWRARKRGWRSVLVPQAIAYHEGHASGEAIKSHGRWYLGERNRLRTWIKNVPVSALLRHPLKILLDDLRTGDMIRRQAGLATLARARARVLVEAPRLLRWRWREPRGASARAWEEWLSLDTR